MPLVCIQMDDCILQLILEVKDRWVADGQGSGRYPTRMGSEWSSPPTYPGQRQLDE